MPKKDYILDLPSFSIRKVTGTNPLILDVYYRKKARCPYCDNRKLRMKDSFIRTVRHQSFGHKQTLLRFKAYKYYCAACRRYFNQRFPGILKYQRATEKLRYQVFHQHNNGASQHSLALDFQLGKATIERWYHAIYQRENQEILHRHCPQILGIDEHCFSRRHRFATTFCDLKKHKIFDIYKGRSAADLKSHLLQLPGKDKVKVVCIDLSPSYKSLVQQYFPSAKIVADRFHVIRLINHQWLQTYHHIDPQLKYNRGLLSCLRTNPENLTPRRRQLRDHYFLQQPAIQILYQFKLKLHQLMMYKHRKARHCKRLIPLLLKRIEQLKQSSLKPLVQLGKTLYQWKEAIVCMWRFTKSNGITEGFHRKMKLIQRRAYGFKNFENYRLRVRVLCG